MTDDIYLFTDGMSLQEVIQCIMSACIRWQIHGYSQARNLHKIFVKSSDVSDAEFEDVDWYEFLITRSNGQSAYVFLLPSVRIQNKWNNYE